MRALPFLLLAACATVAPKRGMPVQVEGVVRGPDRQPVAGVTVSIANNSGSVDLMATTDDDGKYAIPLPEAGTYTVRLFFRNLRRQSQIDVPAIESFHVDLTFDVSTAEEPERRLYEPDYTRARQ